MKKYAMLLFILSFMAPTSVFAFGAIAVDDSGNHKEPAYGFSTGERSKEEAEHRALHYCRKNANNCRVVIWFKTCGAYAASNHYYGYGYGDTKAYATAQALKMCGRNSCEVVVSKCQ